MTLSRIPVAVAAVALFMSVAAAARAQTGLPIEAFYGTFSGGGVAENRDSAYFAVTARDFDVTIKPEAKGFRIEWTSVIRRGGAAGQPEVRRRKTAKLMQPAKARGVWRCAESGDPLQGKELCWARLEKDTLSMFLMTIDANGHYELQQYDRTISGSGMRLVFKAMRDGEEQRTVQGRLVKTGN